MKYVVIVNGKPGSGKTTFQRYCINYLDETDLAYGYIHSSIAYIKDIYMQLGWDGKKTEKARKDLSILKKMWIDTCNGPLKHIVDYMVKLDDDNDHVVFVDVREESEIIKFKETFDALNPIGIVCTTVFIDRNDNVGIEYGNKSDDNIGQNMSLYEHTIHNDRSIAHLNHYAEEFMKQLLEEE